MDPWALHGMTVQVPDPAASASWLGNVFALDVVHIGQDAAEVRLRDHVRPRSCGSHRRGRPHRARRPLGSVAGLRYLDTSSTGGNHPIMTECDNAG